MPEINMGNLRDELLRKIEDGAKKPFGNWPEAVRPHMEQTYSNTPPTPQETDTVDMEPDDSMGGDDEHHSALDGLDKVIEAIVDAETRLVTPLLETPSENMPNPFEKSEKTPTKLHNLVGELMQIQQRIESLKRTKLLQQEDTVTLTRISRLIDTHYKNLENFLSQIDLDPKNETLNREVTLFIEQMNTVSRQLNAEIEWLLKHRPDKTQS